MTPCRLSKCGEVGPSALSIRYAERSSALVVGDGSLRCTAGARLLSSLSLVSQPMHVRSLICDVHVGDLSLAKIVSIEGGLSILEMDIRSDLYTFGLYSRSTRRRGRPKAQAYDT